MIHNLIQVRRTLWSVTASMLALLAIPASAQVQLLHPTNTVWRYQTDLTVQQDAGTDWVNPGFDDSAWPEGKGLFGNEPQYPYPMHTTGTGLANGLPVANYFRAHFIWSGATAGVMLTGTNYIDDGSIIYLNGVEVTRFNMGPEANAGTPEASAPVANPGGYPNVNFGEPVLVRLAIPLDSLTNGNPNPLVPGDNVIAVQAHQQGTGSSDRVFGLSLYGGGIPDCFPDSSQLTNRAILEGRSTTFTLIVNCFPPPTIQWYRDVGAGEELIPGATGTSFTLTNADQPFDTGFYYAKITTLSGTLMSLRAYLEVYHVDILLSLVSGRLGANNLEIIVTANEALCPDDSCIGNASLTFNWEVYVEGDQNQQLGIAGITVNGNTLTFTLSEFTPWALDTRYVVGLLPFGGGIIGDLYGNLLSGGDPFSSVTTAAAASAISVRAPDKKSELYTFDLEPSSFEFTTTLMVGESGGAIDLAALEVAIQTLNTSSITTGLSSAFGTPPSANSRGQYASEGRYLITRPAGTLANNIIARIRNDTGRAGSFFGIRYDLSVERSTPEEVPGHLVYYSLSGAPNTWLPISNLTGDGTAGAKSSSSIFLGENAWAPGAILYVVWVDDNGSGSPDTAYEIDNLRVTLCGVECDDLFNCSYPWIIEYDNSPSLVTASALDSTTIVLAFDSWMKASAATTAPYTVSGATVTAAAFNNADQSKVVLTTTPRAVGNANLIITGLKIARSCESMYDVITPNPTTVNITTVQKVVEWNASWEYNTNNLDAALDWKTTGGTGWQTGNGLFGTELSAGVVGIMPTPIATVIPPPNVNNEFMVSYFRKTVTLPTLAAGQSYALGYMIDDGAVFYLDGEEIGRVNMPAGPVAYGTNAIVGIDGSLLALPFTATPGNHVLAAEVHQNVNMSSDTLFGVSVLVVPTAAPALTIVHSGTNALVSWNADASWSLVGSTSIAGPYAPVSGAGRGSYSRPISTPATQFYKLNYVPQP